MNRKFNHRFWGFSQIFLILVMGWAGLCWAYNHPELEWRTIETEHFFIYYHQGVERSAGLVAKIAEEVYHPVTSVYDFEPEEKVHIIVRDTDDYANGVAYYYENKIEIWATSMDLEFRGTHHWLRNVVTHEFIHLVSLQAARKVVRHLPALYIQYIGYQRENGYPHVLVSYPLLGTIVPCWFAEGVAQYQAPGLEHDSWDTHRDMVLRMAVLEDELLSYDEMGCFGKTGLEDEMVYNQGFSLVSYIAEMYGMESLRKLMRAMRSVWRLTFDSALKKVIGRSGDELYDEWKEDLEQKYGEEMRDVRKNIIEGERLTDEGYLNIYPAWSPDGEKIAYLSNRGNDYHIMDLYIISVDDKEVKPIAGEINSSISWSPDGKKILYSKENSPNKYGSHFNDVYVYDVDNKKEERLTHGLRAKDPAWSPDGGKIVFVTNGDGNNNIGVMNVDGSNVRYLTDKQDGTQFYNPRWSSDGEEIVFSISKGERRDIGIIRSDGSNFRYLVASEGDDRDPCWTPDGEKIVFSSDRNGIYNLYSLSLANREAMQVTNVMGGAFTPSVSPDGEIAFSYYCSEGYKLHLLAAEEGWKEVSFTGFVKTMKDNPVEEADVRSSSKPYRLTFSKNFIYPRIAIDDQKVKAGLYFSSNDVLDKQSLFSGLLVSRDRDLDLYVVYEVKQFAPTLFVEYYKQMRHPTDKVRVDMNEVEIGGRYEFDDTDPTSEFYYINHLSLIFRYSLYTCKSETIEDNKLIVFKYPYFRGKGFCLRWEYKSIRRAKDDQINPTGGRSIELGYERSFDKWLDDFEIRPYGIEWVYKKYYYNRYTLDWREYISMPFRRHALTFRLKGGVIDEPVNEFFYFPLGGQDGLRGYSYYSLEGRKMLMGSLTYRFPIFKDMGKQAFHIYLDKLYGAIFSDVGNAWNGDRLDLGDFKRDAGLELRLEAVSFYTYSTHAYLQIAYGFDNEDRDDRWRYYLGVSLGFGQSRRVN